MGGSVFKKVLVDLKQQVYTNLLYKSEHKQKFVKIIADLGGLQASAKLCQKEVKIQEKLPLFW